MGLLDRHFLTCFRLLLHPLYASSIHSFVSSTSIYNWRTLNNNANVKCCSPTHTRTEEQHLGCLLLLLPLRWQVRSLLVEFFLYWCGFFFINNKYTFVVAVRVLYDLRQVLFLLFSFCAFCGGDSERLIKLGERERESVREIQPIIILNQK